MYGKIENSNNNIILGLPRTAKMKDGRDVSGYNLLSEKILISEGWQIAEEVKPSYDPSTQILKEEKREIVEGEIIVTYIAADKPQEEIFEEQI